MLTCRFGHEGDISMPGFGRTGCVSTPPFGNVEHVAIYRFKACREHGHTKVWPAGRVCKVSWLVKGAYGELADFIDHHSFGIIQTLCNLVFTYFAPPPISQARDILFQPFHPILLTPISSY